MKSLHRRVQWGVGVSPTDCWWPTRRAGHMGSRSRDQDDRIGGDEPVSDGLVDESAAAVLGDFPSPRIASPSPFQKSSTVRKRLRGGSWAGIGVLRPCRWSSGPVRREVQPHAEMCTFGRRRRVCRYTSVDVWRGRGSRVQFSPQPTEWTAGRGQLEIEAW